jgi:hypothetical protein
MTNLEDQGNGRARRATKPHVIGPMSAFNFLIGKWQGKVRYEPDANQRQEAFWTAHVHYNVGGHILLIDESGSEIENRSTTTVEILVVVYWDLAAQEYPARLYWFSKDGAGSVEGKSYVQDNLFVLQTNQLGAVKRYTIRLNEKGQWHEVGEISDGGGESWKQTFEMTLNRQD